VGAWLFKYDLSLIASAQHLKPWYLTAKYHAGFRPQSILSNAVGGIEEDGREPGHIF